MSLTKSQCSKDAIRAEAMRLGFDAFGVAVAAPVSAEAAEQYNNWLAAGHHDCMEYAERYQDIRNNPQLLLEGAKSVIVVAINYYPPRFQDPDLPQIAYYAYGNDYHEVVKEKLFALAKFIKENFGADSRPCVDSAPIREKYWAQQAGIGFVGRNNLLIIPGKGSFFFLGELVTTLELEADKPMNITCGSCRLCVDNCPGGALSAEGIALDASRCLSCQLIERRGELPDWVIEAKGNRLYGCDECQRVCPHNAKARATTEAAFQPREEILSLSTDDVAAMEQGDFSRIFSHSAIKRVKLAGLKRNIGK